MASFTNFATLTHNGQSRISNTVTGEILETLSISKTAAADSYRPGGDVSYIVSLINTGTTALADLTITDDLGGYEFEQGLVYPLAYQAGSLRLFVNGAPQPAPTVTAGPPLVISGLTVPAGGNLLLVYEAEITAFAPLAAGSAIVNTATVTGEGLVTPLSASATISTAEAAALSVRKALDPVTVEPGGSVTYSFLIENSGNTAVNASENAALADTFDPILSDLSVSLDGAPWTAGVNYSYEQSSGVFTTLPGQLAVPAASYAQSPDGSWAVTPGSVTLTVTGTL